MTQFLLTCPACDHQTDFLSALRDTEQRAFLQRLIKDVPDAKMPLIMRYLAMFKPRLKAQSFKALNSRLDQLLALLKERVVKRDGETRAAPPEIWFTAMEELTNNKPATLELPLKTHNYLKQMVWAQGDRAAAKIEAQQEQAKRNRIRDDAAGSAGLKKLQDAFSTPKKR